MPFRTTVLTPKIGNLLDQGVITPIEIMAEAREACASRDGYELIPEALLAGIRRYVDGGIKPGTFLTAVLENRLADAVGLADHHSIHALKPLITWIYNNEPSACWGSPERVSEWLAEHPESKRRNLEVAP